MKVEVKIEAQSTKASGRRPKQRGGTALEQQQQQQLAAAQQPLSPRSPLSPSAAEAAVAALAAAADDSMQGHDLVPLPDQLQAAVDAAMASGGGWAAAALDGHTRGCLPGC